MVTAQPAHPPERALVFVWESTALIQVSYRDGRRSGFPLHIQHAKGEWPGGAPVCGLQGVASHFFDTLRGVLVADGSLACVIVLAWFCVHQHRSVRIQ